VVVGRLVAEPHGLVFLLGENEAKGPGAACWATSALWAAGAGACRPTVVTGAGGQRWLPLCR
jgi:hypothetical protein